MMISIPDFLYQVKQTFNHFNPAIIRQNYNCNFAGLLMFITINILLIKSIIHILSHFFA